MRRVFLFLWERGYNVAQTASRSSTRFTVGQHFRTSRELQFVLIMGKQTGISLGSGHAGDHPFHCPAAGKTDISRFVKSRVRPDYRHIPVYLCSVSALLRFSPF